MTIQFNPTAGHYEVFKGGTLLACFDLYSRAVEYAQRWEQ